ncbi:MAG: VOC family protein [Acidobacteria bacterium]|nr:VOC family protein [Acidobacteriota bacterium]
MGTRIHPVIRYRNARAMLQFLEQAFGFRIGAVYDGPNGSVAHAELHFGTGTIGVSSAGPPNPANVWTTVVDGVYVALADPDAHHARAIAAGARVERPLEDTPYGSREYTARDSGGHLWSFGTFAMNDVAGPPVFVVELLYDDGEDAASFLTRAFGFERGRKVRDAHQRLLRAEVRLDDQPLLIAADAAPEWRGRRQCTHVRVDDVDAHHARAAAAGATIVRAPHDTENGTRAYLAQDPEGFLWTFGM